MGTNKILSIAAAGLFTLLAGCGGGSPSGTGSPGSGGTGSSPAAAIALTATPPSILTSGTSSLSATVTTAIGGNVPDGTRVTFSLSSAMGTLSPTSATTSGGLAGTTFTAGTVPGTVTVTATSGSASQTTAISITPPAAGAIQFISATPAAIGVRGSGQAVSSTVLFRVRDTNGNPVANATVSFTMAGPSGGRQPSLGGEYIGTDDGSPTTTTAVTVAGGDAVVTLNSGSIAGTVTISGSVVTPTGTASASSSVISIGGAIPSARHFNLATTRFNLPGIVISGAQATITALIADRFANFNILTGTTVSFYTEGGAIDANNTVGTDGRTNVVFRTQAPQPDNVTITAAEQAAIAALNATYGLAIPTDGTVHPRDGWVSLLATVNGEESFTDNNGDGVYDPLVDTFPPSMDLGEPYIDNNDNGVHDAGEPFVDANNNAVYDLPNGVWDGPGCTGAGCQQTKMIWATHKLAFTGHAAYCAASPGSFAIPTSGSQPFRFMVGDQNLNRMVPGTTIVVTATKGTLAGVTNYTVTDGIGGPTEISFTLLDDSDATLDAAAVNIVVTPPAAEGVSGCSVSVTGTIQ